MGTQSNVLVGTATLFIAPKGTAVPVFQASGIITTPATPWVNSGFTESGVILNVDQKVSDIRVETEPTPMRVVLTSTTVTIDITFSEDTIQNMKFAYGGGLITTNAPTTTEPGTSVLTLAAALTTVAVLLTGTNAFGLSRTVYIPEMVSAGKTKTSYVRVKSARTYPATFTALCPMATVVITDATAIAS